MHTQLILGSGKRRIIVGLLVILSVALLFFSGCIDEQAANLSECINQSLTKPISPSEAVIVALADPEVAGMLENYSVDISVGGGSSPEAREEAFRKYYSVRIDRYELITHEQTTSLRVAVTYDGRIYTIHWEPPIRGPLQPPENLTAENTAAS